MPIKFSVKGVSKATTVPVDPGNPYNQIEFTDFPQNYAMYHAHKATASERPARHHNVIHASDLDPERKWCPREPALLTKANLKRKPGFISTAQQTVFNFGHKGSDLFREMLPPEIVWGNWKCLACGHEMKHRYTPETCASCNAHRKAIQYREVFMRDPDTGVVGSVDLMVDVLRNGRRVIIETKTEGNESFKARNKATFDHEWRTKFYMWLATQTPWLKGYGIDPNTARVVYISKEGHAENPAIAKWGLPDAKKSAFKEYIVKREDSFLDNALEAVRTYRKWRNAYDPDTGQYALPMPERICKTKNDTRAQACDACALCFK